ncbi:MAG: sulfatase-like hydrolase/transferase [Lentisphaerae bacterium]|nr:sulfatase-like hydrolase/transferase [Lentisphaerota bacterium]MBT4816150.1 sulfatase-like hydrolase/transferase [Lentisphaerota bacterium]MBT5605265.1 sulfatase-like hydrolase/transferase [Lentisphaerota bacterium]MBT7059244.1 sulfatase-like hydrolase/transferase [Lentisphaerota bacterium]MBT7844599.1 sulfatase-like hydrolase/transferase [Lentisphaerota bacterium]
MKRRDFLATTAVGLASLGRALPASPDRPNLLFIMTDQQRHDALSIAGNPVLKTPNLDQLAREGAWFERAYTQCAVCAPARATILTGRTVAHHGVRSNGLAHVEEDSGVCPMKTFDELLTDRGYRCEYHGKWHMPIHRTACYRQFGVERKPKGRYRLRHFINYRAQLDRDVPRREPRQGEQMSEYGRPYTVDPMDRWFGLPSGQDARKSKRRQPDYHGRLEIPADHSMTAYQGRCTVEALQRAARQSAPFSITASINFPHSPILPTAPYYGMYPPEEITPPASISDPMTNSPYRRANGRTQMPEYADPDKIRYMISNYYGLVREIDDWVGRILEELDRLGLRENTLVIFTSDHGEMLGAHGMREKNVFYEESARIPLILRFPERIRGGTCVAEPVSNLDLFATIMDYLGAGRVASDGESLRDTIEGRSTRPGYIVTEWNYHGPREPNYMVTDGRWKLLTCYSPESSIVNALYDLQEDPHEMTNLLGRNPEREQYRDQGERMKGLLVAWLERIGHAEHAVGVAKRPVINPNILLPGLTEIGVVCGDPVAERGVAFERESSVTRNEPVEAGGRGGWRTVRRKPGNRFRYVYFTVDYADFESGAKPHCRVSLDYFDEGYTEVTIVYDSSDATVKVVPRAPGAWKPGVRFTVGDSKTWKRATFEIHDARFAHRQNGRDIRVQVQGDRELTFGGLTIEAIAPPPGGPGAPE